MNEFRRLINIVSKNDSNRVLTENQNASKNTIDEIEYSNSIADSGRIIQSLIPKNSKKLGVVDHRTVYLLNADDCFVYYLYDDDKNTPLAYIITEKNANRGYYPFRQAEKCVDTPGVAMALLQFLRHCGIKLMVRVNEPLTLKGITWLSKMIETPRGLKIHDGSGKSIDLKELWDEWHKSREDYEHTGKMSVYIESFETKTKSDYCFEDQTDYSGLLKHPLRYIGDSDLDYDDRKVYRRNVTEGSEGTLWRVERSEATGRYFVVKGYNKSRKIWKNKMGIGDFVDRKSAESKADELNKGVTEGTLKICSDKNPKLIGFTLKDLDRLSESAGSNFSKFDLALKKNLNLPKWTNTLELYGVYLRKLSESKTGKLLKEGHQSSVEKTLFKELSQRSIGSIDSAKVGDKVSLLHLTTLNIPDHKVVARLNGFLTPKEIVNIKNSGSFQQLEFSDGSRYPEKDGGDIFQQTQGWNMTKLFPTYESASKAYTLYALMSKKLSDELDFQTNIEQGVTEAKSPEEFIAQLKSLAQKPPRITNTCRVCGKKWQLQHHCKGPSKNQDKGVAEGSAQKYLWHGSRQPIQMLEPRQAVDTGGAAGSNQNAIYATGDPKVAIAMGLTAPGSDTAMFPNDPQMVLFGGKIRKGENVYLHKLPMNGPDGKPQFVQGAHDREFHSVPGVKGIKPTEIKAVPVDKYLNLIRQATPQDLELRKKYMKQGVAEEKLITQHKPGKCTQCGGPSYDDEQLAEEKDACYRKVKSRYRVWPSAYASGALVKCRRVGAKNWGNKSKKK